jgi:sulfonate transport system substrate-binding protein
VSRRYGVLATLFVVSQVLVPVVQAQGDLLRIGDSKGMYKALLSAAGELHDLSYRVEWAEFPATAPALEALAAGAIDLRGAAAAPLIFALAAGAPIKAVAAFRPDGPRESVAMLVLPGSPIQRVSDLRGKRIGTNKGSVGHHLVLAALQRDHIPLDQVSIQFLMPAEARAALQGGSVDAWSTWDPYVSIGEVQDGMRAIADGTGLSMTDGVLVASVASIDTKRAALADFLRRYARAQRWIRAHADVYAKLYSEQTGVTLATAALIVRHMTLSVIPIDEAVIREHQGVADLYFSAGVIRRKIDVATAFDRSLLE